MTIVGVINFNLYLSNLHKSFTISLILKATILSSYYVFFAHIKSSARGLVPDSFSITYSTFVQNPISSRG